MNAPGSRYHVRFAVVDEYTGECYGAHPTVEAAQAVIDAERAKSQVVGERLVVDAVFTDLAPVEVGDRVRLATGDRFTVTEADEADDAYRLRYDAPPGPLAGTLTICVRRHEIEEVLS